MPRPEQKIIQLTIDGREINAAEGSMLVDAAKQGDAEIPYFCYEPKLGHPVGACRMCLVEIEGIPKLQTSCSTPVKDGMVVHTQTERVHHAQNAVVEFLLVNHPLDCPVCDKGGECPLQDITFGWGLGRSRFIEPKRHFQKPLALSPVIAIDRERCILCYRCVRFSQEIAEDYQLVFEERGAHTFVGTHDGHPYVAPFSGNIIELCPVGALTSQPYRFRARPWDNESAGSVCTLCPAQCNVTLTVRDERVMRVLARDYEGNDEVDDGWLCDKGRFAYQAMHVDERITTPLVRDGGDLRPVSWERALEVAAGLARHKGRAGAVVGGQASNEEGFILQRLMREVLDSPDIDSRGRGQIPARLARALAAPELQARVSDLEFAHTVLVLDTDPRDDMPILDLRIRKGVRRNGVKLAVATARPTSLDVNATVVSRYAPGEVEPFLAAVGAALGSDRPSDDEQVAELVSLLRDNGKDVVILWSERIGAPAAATLLRIAEWLDLGDYPGAGMLQIPTGTNERGLREAGVIPDAGPGYAELSGHLRSPRGAGDIAQAATEGQISALYLFQTDPVRDLPNRALWENALHHVSLVVAHASVLTEGLREHASVIFPAESYAEKEGTVVHPDGRLQRLRIAVAHAGEVQAGWSVLTEIARRAGADFGIERSADAFEQLVAMVPFYDGLTLEEIGGRGARWPERPQASALRGAASAHSFGAPAHGAVTSSPPAQPANGTLRVGTYRPIWAAPEVEISPALKYLVPVQHLELSPQDAARLQIAEDDRVEVTQLDDSAAAQNGEPGWRARGRAEGTRLHGRAEGTRLHATVKIHTGIRTGTAFMAEGLAHDSANALTEPVIEVHKVADRSAA